MPVWNPFNGKSVAIVGNNFALYEKHLGHEIDEHDIVCRFDEGNEILVPEVHGTKLHVAFFSYIVMHNEVIEHITKMHQHIDIVHVTSKFRDHDRIDHTAWDTMYNDECATESDVCDPSSMSLVLHYLSKCNPARVDIYGLHYSSNPSKLYYATSADVANYEKEIYYIHDLIENQKNWQIRG